jgi:hypothetical protein
MTRVVAQTRKELTQLARDRLALALALLLPVLQLVLMGSSLSLIVKDLPLVVQDLDDSPASRELIEGFRGSLTFRIVGWPPDRPPEEALISGNARGVLVIPPSFGREVLRGTDVPGGRIRRQYRRTAQRVCGGRHGGLQREARRGGGRACGPGGRALLVQPRALVAKVLRARHLRDGAVHVSTAARHAGHGA